MPRTTFDIAVLPGGEPLYTCLLRSTPGFRNVKSAIDLRHDGCRVVDLGMQPFQGMDQFVVKVSAAIRSDVAVLVGHEQKPA